MISIVLATALSLHAQPAAGLPASGATGTPKTWPGETFRFVRTPWAPGGAPGVVKIRCRVRDSGRLAGCRYSQASNHEFGALAVHSALESRILMREDGPRAGDYVEFWLQTVDTNGAR